MIMIVLVLRTKPSGLYRHQRGLGLHRVGYNGKVPSGHGTKSSILYLHSPGVRPKVIVRPSGHPLIQDSLSEKNYFFHFSAFLLFICEVKL